MGETRQADVNFQELYKHGQGEVEAKGVDGVNRLYAFTRPLWGRVVPRSG